MRHKNINAICLDLDGTLINPKVGITTCINYALESLGRKALPQDDLTWCIGPPLHESFKVLMQDDDLAKKALELYRERYREKGLYENELYPDIKAVLADFNTRQIDLYLATSKPRVFAKTILEYLKLANFFKAIHGSELDGTNADKTDLLSFIIKAEKLIPENTLMIGDRKFDIIGAKNNKIASIGVLYGYGSKEELSNAGCKNFAERFADLREMV